MIVKANEGSQEFFVRCPYYEVLYHGTRGPGKSFGLGLSFLQYVNKGFGSDYKGIIFRRKYKELYELRMEFDKLFTNIFGRQMQHNKSTNEFIFPNGEILMLAFAQHDRDYLNFHGHQFPFLAFDELTNWSSDTLINSLKSICRTKNKNIPTRIRYTTNSLGPGHSWVKEYFKIMEVPSGQRIVNEQGLERTAIFGSLLENKYIMQDKNYIRFLRNQKDPNILKSWLEGSWDIVAGGAISDLWRVENHIVKPFREIPEGWRVYRTLDWGSSKPYAALYFAKSDGTSYLNHEGHRKHTKVGDVFVIGEVYGFGGQANVGTKETPKQVRVKLTAFEKFLKQKYKFPIINAGPADSANYNKPFGEDEKSIMDFLKPLNYFPCKKGSGSRVAGLEIVREYLHGSILDKFHQRENKGIFFFNTCSHTIRTLPTLVRDEKNPEDVDTNGEDHCYDVIRYFLSSLKSGYTQIVKF